MALKAPEHNETETLLKFKVDDEFYVEYDANIAIVNKFCPTQHLDLHKGDTLKITSIQHNNEKQIRITRMRLDEGGFLSFTTTFAECEKLSLPKERRKYNPVTGKQEISHFPEEEIRSTRINQLTNPNSESGFRKNDDPETIRQLILKAVYDKLDAFFKVCPKKG